MGTQKRMQLLVLDFPMETGRQRSSLEKRTFLREVIGRVDAEAGGTMSPCHEPASPD